MTMASISRSLGTVMVVDDVDMNCSLVQSVLEVHGYEVVLAQRGSEELLTRISQDPPDLIILDVMMPGINGLAMCQRLRADPRTMAIPIIMVTSLTDRSVRLRAISAGATGVMLKPIDTQELHFAVRNAVAVKRELDQLRAASLKLSIMEGKRRSWISAFLQSMAQPAEAVHDEAATLARQLAALAANPAATSVPSPAALAGRVDQLTRQAALLQAQVASAIETNEIHTDLRSLVLEHCHLATLIGTAKNRLREAMPQIEVLVEIPEVEITCDRKALQKALTALVLHIGQNASRNVLIQGIEKPQGTQLTFVADVLGQGHSEVDLAANQAQTSVITNSNPFRDVRLAFCAFVIDAHGGTLRGDRVNQSERVKIFLPEFPIDAE